ncbi:LuxR C-terminal-related transcriptional regulator [Actinoplanes sp. G11-F43]|uniref:LuxR C-terminal-related transcriptional regulator n=1 Tax=Actinoplanes sp. G11-F43 TaxID=3424130 RepID=UPI003D32AA72
MTVVTRPGAEGNATTGSVPGENTGSRSGPWEDAATRPEPGENTGSRSGPWEDAATAPEPGTYVIGGFGHPGNGVSGPGATEIVFTGAGPREIVIAGEAGDGVEAVDLARRLAPDVLIADVALPRLDGLAVARAVTEARLAVRVLLLTGRDTDDEVVAAVSAGAAGYLRKDSPHGELTAAVYAVAAGGAVISPPVLARVLTRLAEALPGVPDGSALARLAPLTGREREVLTHVARGLSNTEIAGILGVGETTVKTHVGHVLTKLRLRDRTQAVVVAYETGLVRPRV